MRECSLANDTGFHYATRNIKNCGQKMHQLVKSGTEAIAAKFVAARRAGSTLAIYPGDKPATLAQAYAIQDAAIALRGEAIAGWKIGRIHAPLAEEFGTTRLIGPVAASPAVSRKTSASSCGESAGVGGAGANVGASSVRASS